MRYYADVDTIMGRNRGRTRTPTRKEVVDQFRQYVDKPKQAPAPPPDPVKVETVTAEADVNGSSRATAEASVERTPQQVAASIEPYKPIRCPTCSSPRRKDVERKRGATISRHRCLDCGHGWVQPWESPIGA
jgi:hypothetical protein